MSSQNLKNHDKVSARAKEILHDLAARFLLLNSNKSSLLTVTRVELSRDKKRATIFFTVFPEEFEKTALEFAKRKCGDFKEFVKEKARLGKIPQVDFEIDSVVNFGIAPTELNMK